MSQALESFVADLPSSLHWADELLTRYGRWCTASSRGGRRCGSAEGMYRPPAREDDVRRTGTDALLPSLDAMRCQRALVRVPDRERVVLHVLYVPQRLPVAEQLRILRIDARTCRYRHRDGVLMFADFHRLAS